MANTGWALRWEILVLLLGCFQEPLALWRTGMRPVRTERLTCIVLDNKLFVFSPRQGERGPKQLASPLRPGSLRVKGYPFLSKHYFAHSTNAQVIFSPITVFVYCDVWIEEYRSWGDRMVQWSLFLSFLFSLLFDALQLPLWWWRRRLKEIGRLQISVHQLLLSSWWTVGYPQTNLVHFSEYPAV